MTEPEIIRNTDKYLVVYKYEGTPFHTIEGKRGILQIIREMEASGKLAEGPRLYPVHRLDMVTSGIILFARGKKMANYMGNEFRFNRVQKLYVAISDRRPKKKQGTVSGDMEKGRGGRWILSRSHKNPAVTHFESEAVNNRRPGLRAYFLRPKTGRTHQIRVAMKSLGAPILGDPLYGRFDLAREEDRTYLHAAAIRIQLPDEVLTVIEPPRTGMEFLTDQFKEIFNRRKEYFP